MKKYFSDKMEWDGVEKTAVSVRDGVLEYYGVQLGLEPYEKVFKVYRSPATISNVANRMKDIPVTDDHVSLDDDVIRPIGKVVESEMIDLMDETYDSKLAIKNKLNINDPELLETIGNKQLSLGYAAKLVDHDVYDFEQKDIMPHHLAIVESGRCGAACSFLDKKEVILMGKNRFIDENGDTNLEEIVRVVQDFMEAIKKAPVDKVQEVLPSLKEIIALANDMAAENTEEVVSETESTNGDDTTETKKDVEEVLDEDNVDEEEEIVKVMDSKKFTDALKSAINRDRAVIQKASEFLDSRYKFEGKTTYQIMRDAVRTQHPTETFKDSELDIAFKLLKKVKSNVSNFGDGESDVWAKLKAKKF